MDRRAVFPILGGGLILSACTVGEDFVKPTVDLAAQYPLQSADATRRTDQKWWQSFNDPLLSQLIEVGLKQNLDIRRALERIEYSNALGGAAGYAFSGTARIGESKIAGGVEEETISSSFIRTEVSWVFDLFGEYRRAKEAAGYNLDAAYEDADIARLVFISDIAKAYLDMRYFQQLIRINRRVLETRIESHKFAEQLHAEGKASELEVAQARSIVATAEANLPESKIYFADSVSRIIVLLGEANPQRRHQFDVTAPQPTVGSKVVKMGIPADLVRYRPEIRRAEKRYAEAVALAGVAKADMYPSLQLTGNINANLVSSDFIPPAGFLKLGLDIPYVNYPVRKAKAEAQLARSREYRLIWEEEVIDAVAEVSNAQFSLILHQDAVKAATTAVKDAKEVLRLARIAFSNEEISFFQVMDAERSSLNAENSLAMDTRNLALDFVNLNVALGGSYRPA